MIAGNTVTAGIRCICHVLRPSLPLLNTSYVCWTFALKYHTTVRSSDIHIQFRLQLQKLKLYAEETRWYELKHKWNVNDVFYQRGEVVTGTFTGLPKYMWVIEVLSVVLLSHSSGQVTESLLDSLRLKQLWSWRNCFGKLFKKYMQTEWCLCVFLKFPSHDCLFAPCFLNEHITLFARSSTRLELTEG